MVGRGKRSTRKEKEGNFLEKENIWPVEEKKNERERDKIIWRRKRKKYLEMEIIWSAEEQNNKKKAKLGRKGPRDWSLILTLTFRFDS